MSAATAGFLLGLVAGGMLGVIAMTLMEGAMELWERMVDECD